MSIWKHLFSLEERRSWWMARAPEGPLRDYYQVPFTPMDADWRSIDYLALDFETTGLDPQSDEILSVGHTVIRGHTMKLAENEHYLVKPSQPIPEASAVVHGILDDHIEQAVSMREALPWLLEALAGKVMIAHHAAVEYGFLNRACRAVYGYSFNCPVVDTLALEVRAFRRRDEAPKSGDLRLANVRRRYGLPRYRAHNALIDAIAAGEVFLAQAADRSGRKPAQLADLTVVT